MENETKRTWTIRVREIHDVKISFSEEVTAEEAEAIYMAGDYEDVLDDDLVDTEEVLEVH
ncbi:MAG: hypothetical protein WCY93_07885 [Anaerolineaceae bacterium]